MTLRNHLINYMKTGKNQFAKQAKDILLSSDTFETAKANYHLVSSKCPGRGKRLDNPFFTGGMGFFIGLVTQGCMGVSGGASLMGMAGMKAFVAGGTLGMTTASVGTGLLYCASNKPTYGNINVLWAIAANRYELFSAQKFLKSSKQIGTVEEGKIETYPELKDNIDNYFETNRAEFVVRAMEILSNVNTLADASKNCDVALNLWEKYGKDLARNPLDERNMNLYALARIAAYYRFEQTTAKNFLSEVHAAPEAISYDPEIPQPAVGLRRRRV